MIVRLRGTVLEAREGRAVIEAGGVGYEVLLTRAASTRLPPSGEEASLHIVESAPMYGGGITLYGFLEAEEKALFQAIKDHVPSTGAKKALEVLEKASRSLPDFRRCVLEKDPKGLSQSLGFTRKTAERLVTALKDRLPAAVRLGAPEGAPALSPSGPLQQALQALTALGYRTTEARAALDDASQELSGREARVEEIIRLALKRL